MDVAAGITPAGKWTRLDENAPSFKMWLQRHPSISNLFINVLILERHLSKEFAEEIEASLEEARFAKYKTNNAFLRFVTDMPYSTWRILVKLTVPPCRVHWSNCPFQRAHWSNCPFL